MRSQLQTIIAKLVPFLLHFLWYCIVFYVQRTIAQYTFCITLLYSCIWSFLIAFLLQWAVACSGTACVCAVNEGALFAACAPQKRFHCGKILSTFQQSVCVPLTQIMRTIIHVRTVYIVHVYKCFNLPSIVTIFTSHRVLASLFID